jgi:hypothetical protein
MVVAASCYGYACHWAKTWEFFRIKRNRIALNQGKILEENLVQYASQQTLGDKFTIQQDNNLKHELLTKMTLNVPEWLSYSFDIK